jgi:hypothetical protein
MISKHGAAARGFADAERVQRGEGVGSKLDASADLADLVGLLKQFYADALLRQRKRCGESANAAADDEDFLLGLSGGYVVVSWARACAQAL